MARTATPGRQDAILDAALYLFAKKGYSGTTMADIAKQARVATGTLYLYFGDKEQVLTSCAMRFHHNHLQEVKSLLEDDTSASYKLETYLLSRFHQWKSETRGAKSGTDLALAMLRISPEITKKEQALWSKTLKDILQLGAKEKKFFFSNLKDELRIFHFNLVAYFPLPGAEHPLRASEEDLVKMIHWFCRKWSSK